MRSPFYLRQLKRDLARWVQDGLIHADEVDGLLASAGLNQKSGSLQTILAILGCLFLGASAISYLAANYGSIPRLSLLLIGLVLMWLAYGIGGLLIKQNRAGIGHAAILLGALMFGANIMLIAQMYHISAHYPNGVLAWALGALAIAGLTPSRAALGLSFTLATIWTTLEATAFDVTFHWPFLMFWLAASILSHALKWRAGFHLSFLTFIYWLALNTVDLAESFDWQGIDILTVYGSLWLLLWVKGCLTSSLDYRYGQALARYGMLLFLITFSVFQVFPEDGLIQGLQTSSQMIVLAFSVLALLILFLNWRRDAFNLIDVAVQILLIASIVALPYLATIAPLIVKWLYSGLMIISAIWFLSLGSRYNERFIINLALIAFGAETLYIYFRELFGTLLNQSIFFGIGGLILVALVILLEYVRRHSTGEEEGEDAYSYDTEEVAG